MQFLVSHCGEHVWNVWQWCVHHINLLIGWAMFLLSVAIEPLAKPETQKALFTIEEIALANEYATFFARLLQIATVLIGLIFMIRDKQKNETESK